MRVEFLRAQQARQIQRIAAGMQYDIRRLAAAAFRNAAASSSLQQWCSSNCNPRAPADKQRNGVIPIPAESNRCFFAVARCGNKFCGTLHLDHIALAGMVMQPGRAATRILHTPHNNLIRRA